MTDEQQTTQNGSEAEEPEILEITLRELADKLKAEPGVGPYYCVDRILDNRTKRKLIDPRSVLNHRIVTRIFDHWNLSSDTVVRVTRNLEVFDRPEDTAKTIAHYSDTLHRYLMAIFTREKPSYKVEVQGLVNTAIEMLNTVFSFDKIENVTIGPDDLRPFSSYYDHLVNTTVYWLATFAALNRKYEGATGAVEVWRSRNKAELRNLLGAYGELPKDIVLYYDIYGIGQLDKETEKNKRGDMGLVLSGFFGALFHDAGLIDEPEIIISREGHIDEKLMAHVDASNALLKKRLPILFDERPLVRSIIKNHHERVDGKGYPRGVKTPHLFAQILSVVDNYEEFCAKFVRGKVIRFLARAAGRQYEGDVVRAFLSILSPYAEGETVDVFEGKGGEPVMTGKIVSIENKFKPTVRISDSHSPHFSNLVGADVDLALDENITFFI